MQLRYFIYHFKKVFILTCIQPRYPSLSVQRHATKGHHGYSLDRPPSATAPSISPAIIQLMRHCLFANLIMQDAVGRYPGPLCLISSFLCQKDPSHPNSGPRHSPDAIDSPLAYPPQRSLSPSLCLSLVVRQHFRFNSPQRKLWSLYIHSSACNSKNDFDSEEFEGVFVLSTQRTVVYLGLVSTKTADS